MEFELHPFYFPASFQPSLSCCSPPNLIPFTSRFRLPTTQPKSNRQNYSNSQAKARFYPPPLPALIYRRFSHRRSPHRLRRVCRKFAADCVVLSSDWRGRKMPCLIGTAALTELWLSASSLRVVLARLLWLIRTLVGGSKFFNIISRIWYSYWAKSGMGLLLTSRVELQSFIFSDTTDVLVH